ncbi:hypothetical protein TNCV_3984371 [Trichonephila clavipes]|nr:hypothetical protein TNCV_3984371 [Trichonephila clavipes]
MMNAEERSNICDRLPCFHAPPSTPALRILHSFSGNPQHPGPVSFHFQLLIAFFKTLHLKTNLVMGRKDIFRLNAYAVAKNVSHEKRKESIVSTEKDLCRPKGHSQGAFIVSWKNNGTRVQGSKGMSCMTIRKRFPAQNPCSIATTSDI